MWAKKHGTTSGSDAPFRRGFSFSPDGLSVAKKTLENFAARAIRLYEQEPGEASRLLPAWVVRAAVRQVAGAGLSERPMTMAVP